MDPVPVNFLLVLGNSTDYLICSIAGGGGVYLRKGRPILNKRSIVDACILPPSIFTPRVLPHARIGKGGSDLNSHCRVTGNRSPPV